MNIKQIKKKLKDAKELRDFKENLKKLVKEIGLNQNDLDFLKQNNDLLNQQIGLLKDFGLEIFLDDVEPLLFQDEPMV